MPSFDFAEKASAKAGGFLILRKKNFVGFAFRVIFAYQKSNMTAVLEREKLVLGNYDLELLNGAIDRYLELLELGLELSPALFVAYFTPDEMASLFFWLTEIQPTKWQEKQEIEN